MQYLMCSQDNRLTAGTCCPVVRMHQLTFGRAPAASRFSYKVPSKM